MKKIILLMFITMTCTIHCYFEKYCAQKAYKQGDIKQAQDLLDEMLTQEPDDAEVAYNLGKVALKQKEFVKAVSYFNHVTQTKTASAQLREQAWYDRGLSQVHMQQWEDALVSYEEVLKINADNEYAQKMIDQIKKILEEKKQQEDQKKKESDENQKDQKSDNDDHSDKNDTEKNNKDTKNDYEQSQQQEQDSSSEQEKKENERNEQKQDSKQSEEQNKEEKSHANNDVQNQKNNNEKQKDVSDDRSSAQSQDQQSAQEKQDKEAASKNQASQNSAQEALQEAKNDGTNDKKVPQEPTDKETMLLQLVEQHDAQMSKALFKRQIQQQMPSRHGQKNW